MYSWNVELEAGRMENHRTVSNATRETYCSVTCSGTADCIVLRIGFSVCMYKVSNMCRSIFSDESIMEKLVLLKECPRSVALLRRDEKLGVVIGRQVRIDIHRC